MEDDTYWKMLNAFGVQASKLDIQMAQFISVVCKYNQNNFVDMLFMDIYINNLTFSSVFSKVI